MMSNLQLEVAEKLQLAGKSYFKKGNYKMAVSKFTEVGLCALNVRYYPNLDIFEQAIDMQPLILMSLLDNRAASYEKLGNLKEALADSKRMIQHEKTNPKAYSPTHRGSG